MLATIRMTCSLLKLRISVAIAASALAGMAAAKGPAISVADVSAFALAVLGASGAAADAPSTASAKAETSATEMAGPLAAAIPASALAAIATLILSFRSEQVMRIVASIDVFRCHPDGCSAEQPEFAAARRRLGHNGRDLP